MLASINSWFETNRDYGAIFIRLVVGAYLVYLQHPNILSYENMVGVSNFFIEIGIPFPFVSAYVSVFAQFIAGIFFILGAFTRYAAAAMIINFIIAFIAVDIHNAYPQNFHAQVMLAAALFFLFNGAGKLSVDEWMKNRSADYKNSNNKLKGYSHEYIKK